MSCRHTASAFFTLAVLATCSGAAVAQAQGIDMRPIPAGSFVMGACVRPDLQKEYLGKAVPCGTPDEQAPIVEFPPHTVHIQPFWLGKTPVTLGQFRQFIQAAQRQDLLTADFLEANAFGDQAPVTWVSWHDAQAFIQWLNQTQGGGWRLPTEAEWEYACRAGGRHTYCGGHEMDAVGWTALNSGPPDEPQLPRPQPVAQKAPNAFGLHDMSGNVWEWVQDCWHDSYQDAPADGSAWAAPCRHDDEAQERVLRGGSWARGHGDARATARESGRANFRIDNHGFRLARDIRQR